MVNYVWTPLYEGLAVAEMKFGQNVALLCGDVVPALAEASDQADVDQNQQLFDTVALACTSQL